MGFFTRGDIGECDALFRPGTVTAVNYLSRTLDVQIGETVHEDVDVHYHCEDGWKAHSHPHSASEREQMLTAFSVGDTVLVMCDDEGRPLYVTGFIGGVKLCGAMLVLPVQDKLQMLDRTAFTQELSGTFKYLKAGGGTGTPSEWLLELLEISLSGGGTFRVNGTVITDHKWTYANWFATTGTPETWEIVPTAGDKTAKTLAVQCGGFYSYSVGLLVFDQNGCYLGPLTYTTGGAGGATATFDFEGETGYFHARVKSSAFFKTNCMPIGTDYDILSAGYQLIGWMNDSNPCSKYNFYPSSSGCVPDGDQKLWIAVGGTSSFSMNSVFYECTLNGVSFNPEDSYTQCVYETVDSENNGNPRPSAIEVKQSVVDTDIEDYCDQFSIDKTEYDVELGYGSGIDERVL